MATDMRRLSISIAPDMEMELHEAKKEIYSMDTQSEMIRDLIIRGLKDLPQKKAGKEKDRTK